MKHTATLSLSLAILSTAFLGSQCALARTNNSSPANAMAGSGAAGGAMQEASQMVPAEASLMKGLNSQGMQPGQMFKAKLDDGVHLANGTDLPRGTVLEGTARTEQGENGTQRLVLRFTTAEMKNGTSLPIKATIVGMSKPFYSPTTGRVEAPVNTWTQRTLQVDQIKAVPGVNLHSKIASSNSGVLDANGSSNVKVNRNDKIELAICARTNG